MDGLESGNKPRGLASLAGGARSIAPRMPEFVVTREDAPHSAKSGQCPILEGGEQYGFVLASKCCSILCRPFRALIDGNRLPGALPRAVISWAFSPGILICVHSRSSAVPVWGAGQVAGTKRWATTARPNKARKTAHKGCGASATASR